MDFGLFSEEHTRVVAVQHLIAAHAEEGDKVKRTTEATLVNRADFISFDAMLRLGPGKQLEARMA